MPKIKVLITIKTDNQEEKLETYCILEDNNLKYLEKDKTKVFLNYSKLEIIRENKKIRMELKFDIKKETSGKILIRGIQKEVIIPIKTTKINKNNNNLQLEYQIEDQKFFYQVEEIKWVY